LDFLREGVKKNEKKNCLQAKNNDRENLRKNLPVTFSAGKNENVQKKQKHFPKRVSQLLIGESFIIFGGGVVYKNKKKSAC